MSVLPKRPIDQSVSLLLLPQLETFVARAVMEQVLDECQVREQRCRKLPAMLVLILCIVTNWFSHEGLADVLQKLVTIPKGYCHV